MPADLLDLIINFHSSQGLTIGTGYSGNKIQTGGIDFENYIKDLFKHKSKTKHLFAYEGNKNNPPDLLLRGNNNGDAIEIKRHNKFGVIALNSSPPRSKFYKNDPMIIQKCCDSENGKWTQRDMLYIVGITKGKKVDSISCFYGDTVFKDNNVYNSLKKRISQSLKSLGFSHHTKELGKVKNIDQAGSYLRIRPMWHTHPEKEVLAKSLKDFSPKNNFNCVMRETKYKRFLPAKISKINLLKKNNKLNLDKVSLPDPDKPNTKIKCILITS